MMISIKISKKIANGSKSDKSQDVAAVQRTSSVPWRRRCVFHYLCINIIIQSSLQRSLPITPSSIATTINVVNISIYNYGTQATTNI